MKAIIIGASLSGKTTIVKELQKVTDNPVSEMDDELTRLNGGKYPSDSDYKNKVLAPMVISEILKKSEILFFTNTDYFSLEDLRKAKTEGFKIIQIDVDNKELLRRNADRVKNEGYKDSGMWIEGMLEYQKNIREKGLVDEVIEGNQPTAQIVKELRAILKI